MEDSVRILHKPNRRFCYFQEKRYICVELFDEMQSAAVQRSYTVAKSLLTTFLISTLRCHSDRYIKVSYPRAKIVVSLNLMFNAIKNTSKRTYYIEKDYLKEIRNGRVEELSTR